MFLFTLQLGYLFDLLDDNLMDDLSFLIGYKKLNLARFLVGHQWLLF